MEIRNGFFGWLCNSCHAGVPDSEEKESEKKIENLKPPYILSERIKPDRPNIKKDYPSHSLQAAVKKVVENLDGILMGKWKCDTRYIYSILTRCEQYSDPYKHNRMGASNYVNGLNNIAMRRKYEEKEGGGAIPNYWSGIQKIENLKSDTPRNGLNDFFFCTRPRNNQQQQPTHRIYIHLEPHFALAVWEFIVTKIVDKPSEFALVFSAKIGGPRLLGVRCDNIVIFTCSPEANQQVIDALGKYQDLHPDHFLDEVPFCTQKVRPGLAWGKEPPEEMSKAMGGHSMSFTEVRAYAIAEAIADLQKKEMSINEPNLLEAVVAKFKKYHIDI